MWPLNGNAWRQRRKFLQLVLGTVLRDADILACSDNNSFMIESSELRDLEDDHVSEEVGANFVNGV